MRSNSPRVAMVALATSALLLLLSAPVAVADKDYSKNSATGDYAGERRAEAPRESVSAPPVQVVTAAKPGDFFDWDDAAIGAGVGLVLGLFAGGATAAVARRRIPSPATEGPAGLTRVAANERRNS